MKAAPLNPNVFSVEYPLAWGNASSNGACFAPVITSDNGFGIAGNYADIRTFLFKPLDNTWHHVVFVFAGSTNFFGYFDGAAMSYLDSNTYRTASALWNTGPGPLTIGSFLNTGWFAGSLDDIRIYNRALSSSEVSQLYVLEAPPLPVIKAQPVSVATNLAANVSFSVSATGTNGVWYQWRKDGVNLPNATNSLYSLTNVQPPSIGNYYVVVTGYGGSITSSVASLALNGVNSAPWQGLVAYYPFNGNANDATPFLNNGVVSNAVLATDRFGTSSRCYTFSPASNSTIICPSGIVPAGVAPLSISFWQKIENPIIVGNSFSKYPVFSVCQDSITKWDYYYAFQPNGVDFSPAVEAFDTNGYLGAFTTWSLFPSFMAATNWHHFVLTFGSNNVCSFILDGSVISPTPSFVTNYHRANGPLFIGQDGSGDWFTGKIDDFRVYNRALSSNEVGQLFASEAVAPTIAQHPISQIVNAYDWVTFSVTANGSTPLYYQWRMGGTNLPNATNSTYIIPAATPANLGAYSCVVSNVAGSATSSSATLYMNPYIASPFAGALAYWGQSATLNVSAWGSGLGYQWYFNGNAIGGATGSSYTMPAIQMTNAGMYGVVVSSIFGSVSNAAAPVTVNPAGVSLSLNPDLVIQGTVGYSYLIQYSTNLANTNAWLTLTNLILSQPVQYWDDTSVQWNQSQRFYRVLPGQ